MAAVSHAKKVESGLASGIVNTSYQIGSVLGLAIMVAVDSAYTSQAENSGTGTIEALNNGFHWCSLARNCCSGSGCCGIGGNQEAQCIRSKGGNDGGGLEYFQDKKLGGLNEPSFNRDL